MNLDQYLQSKNKTSSFPSVLGNSGGNITFSNSGIRGQKQFTLGFDSFINILNDIKINIESFKTHENYNEKEWRELSSFFLDGPATAITQVQTKPTFSTISKIICWANSPELDSVNNDNFCPMGMSYLEKAIKELEELSKKYTPMKKEISKPLTIQEISITQEILNRFLAIKTKPFIILAGLSGTGKSRLVRALAYQFNNIDSDRREQKSPSNFKLIKVKPNWHDSTDLLGYESRISGKDKYVVTEFMRFVADAWKHPETPFFLCLDEMNLAPVEQYFAEYLSVIETREVKERTVIVTDCLVDASIIKKYTGENGAGVDEKFDLWKELNITDDALQNQILTNGLCLPHNFIVVGTVNMDETTHSFSRKVLDRAMTIEMNDINLSEGLTDEGNTWDYPAEPLSAQLVLSEKTHGFQVFSDLAETGETIIAYLEEVNSILEKSPFKIAYRVRDEFLLYAYNYNQISDKPATWVTEVLDNMTVMKILPRIEGDDHKTRVLDALTELFSNKSLQASLKKANEMIEKRNTYHYTSFWS